MRYPAREGRKSAESGLEWVLNAVQVPLFFLLVQLLTAVACLHLAACFGPRLLVSAWNALMRGMLTGFFKIPEMRLSTCKGLTPLIAINCIGLAFNTYCLQFVDASFYQVAYTSMHQSSTDLLQCVSTGRKRSSPTIHDAPFLPRPEQQTNTTTPSSNRHSLHRFHGRRLKRENVFRFLHWHLSRCMLFSNYSRSRYSRQEELARSEWLSDGFGLLF